MTDHLFPQSVLDQHLAEMEALDAAFDQIADLIRTTNNGKLMVMRIPPELRRFVPDLREDGRLIPATFMHTGDSVRL